MKVTTEEVTPAIAADWLTHNTHNRHVQDAKVTEYEQAMKDGRWLEGSGAFVAFDTGGVLRNGQHTLTAQVRANVTLSHVVYRDVTPESQEVMDTGAKRRFADALVLAGETDPNNIAAATNMLYYWDKGLRGTGLTSMGGSAVKRAQIPQLMAYFHDHADEIRDGVTAMAKVRKSIRASGRIMSLSHVVFSRIDDADTAFFFDRLETGESLTKTDPIYQLRKRLQEESMKMSQGRIAASVLLGMIMKAWNMYRDGTEIQVLVFRPGGSSKEQFPEPH